ncbi:putative histone-lysine N-methyltransferase 1 isoform X2 [Condylostylus longicornis]|uniref:putative histone-lysine N-methyltransferase 1 isoform X2 n=1 Tax=Condylostylus longicornis TaxID=2530218 RepID=UPI00244E2E7F|nr:putative histone-lysine N-methyltransferase 1 isoform X2 [Condylostylus longicornis]
MANICIICSSPGDYDIFAPIPAYLHASPNEFLLWPKDISKMMEETTGLVITIDDKLLPRKICALCISYLKHAATFRQQAIDNILNLKAAQLLKIPDKHSIDGSNNIMIKEDQLNFSETRCSELKNILASKPKTSKCDEYLKKNFENSPNNRRKPNLMNDDENEKIENNIDKSSNSNIHLNTYLNLLFDKDTNKTANNRRKFHYINRHKMNSGDINEINQIDLEDYDILTGSSDENDIADYKKTNFFNYKEKNFEEDDILNDILKDANIIINIPEIHKERKCPACCKRFMFEDSYDEHTAMCIEFQLLSLIEDVNRLLIIRRKKTLSPHEFVRRMIFSLKKIADWLRSHGENINIPSQSDVKKISKKTNKKKEDETEAIIENFNVLKASSLENSKVNSSITKCNQQNNENATLEILNNSNYENKIRIGTPDKKHNPKKQPENTFQVIKQNSDKKSSSSLSALCTPSPPNIQKLGHLTTTANYTASPSPKINFSARCSICSVVFEAIADLEDHNAKFHNYQQSVEKEEHKKIIALFEDE